MKASLGCALALAGACLAVRAEAQSVVVGPQASSMALVPGTLVTVPIVADLTSSGGRSLGSVTARLSWRPGVLALRGVGAGALGPPTVNADSAAGTLRFALANPGGALGQPILLNATFAVIGAPGATDTLRVTLQELTNAGTFADLLPIGQTTPAALCVSTGLFGDLDESGTVSSFDALLIVTNAVGLPITPRTSVNGDVDGDGQVNTRDALIVLSYAIALPVGGFRVARLNPGACTIRTGASVQIAPRTVAVTSGDRVPLTATVRDSAGATIQGTSLLWTSADTTVAKTDAAGNVVAVSPGTTRVYANVAPGIKDSVTVSVGATRQVWYVDQTRAAQNGGVELGSADYPFSTVRQALDRAAANDSVMVAPATYGESVRLTTPLTLIGDSTAAGVTTIRNATGPGIAVDSVASGLVRLDRLHIDDSQGGVIVRGTGPALVDLQRVSIARSRGVGISVRGIGRLLLGAVAVQGAVHQGIEVDSVPVVELRSVFVDLVGEPSGPSVDRPAALRIAVADSLVADSLVVGSAGVRLDSARVVRLDHFSAFGSVGGAALAAKIGASLTLDHGDIADVSELDGRYPDYDSAAAVIVLAAPATARIANTTFRHNGRAALLVWGGDSVLVSRVSVRNSPYRLLFVPFTMGFTNQRRVAVEYSSFTDNGAAYVGFDRYAAALVPMSATVDSSTFQGTALRGNNLALLDVRRSRFLSTLQPAVVGASVQTVSLVDVDVGNVSTPSDYAGYGGPFAVDVTTADSLHVDSASFHDNPFGALICRYCSAVQATGSTLLRNGTYSGYVYGAIGTIVIEEPRRAVLRRLTVDGGGHVGMWIRMQGATGGRSVLIDSSLVAGQTILVEADGSYLPTSGDSLVVANSSLRGRGLGGYGVLAYGLGGFTLRGSLVDSVYEGVYVNGPGGAMVQGNTVRAVGWTAFTSDGSAFTVDSNSIAGCASGGIGVYPLRASGLVSRNNITGCTNAVSSYSGFAGGVRVSVLGNTIARDTADLDLGAAVRFVDTFDSVIVARNTIVGGRGPGVLLSGSYYGNLNAARVDSNTVQGVLGEGVVLGSYITNPVAMRYNVLADNGTGLLASVPVLGEFNTLARNKMHGASFTGSASSVFRRGNYAGNVHFAVVKPSGPPEVTADSSYWGRTTGPRFPGDTSSVAGGDSVGMAVVYLPYDTALVASAPPVPAPLPAAVFRAARPVAAVQPRASIRRPPPVSPPQPPGRVQP